MQKEIKSLIPISPEIRLITKRRDGSVQDRFWRKVVKDGPIIRPELGNFWQWVGSRASGRYGSFYFSGRVQPAHRVSWILNNGPIPKGMDVLHKCDYEPCIRPDHLFLGTAKDNALDASRKGKFKNREGEKNPKCKLTSEQVLEIRAKYTTGTRTQKSLSEEYGVGQANIKDIVNRNTWRHI